MKKIKLRTRAQNTITQNLCLPLSLAVHISVYEGHSVEQLKWQSVRVCSGLPTARSRISGCWSRGDYSRSPPDPIAKIPRQRTRATVAHLTGTLQYNSIIPDEQM